MSKTKKLQFALYVIDLNHNHQEPPRYILIEQQ